MLKNVYIIPQVICYNPALVFDKPQEGSNEGYVSYPTDSPTATRLGLCNSLDLLQPE